MLNTFSESVVVTGGAGFIGSHLASALVGRGSRVAVLDNLNDFYDPGLKRRNLAGIGRWGNFEFVLADILDRAAVRDLFARLRPPYPSAPSGASRRAPIGR